MTGADTGAKMVGERKPSMRARIACSEWLTSCLSFGWRKSDLDALEAIWWMHHDDQGRLT